MTTPYIPPGCFPLSESTNKPQRRIGIQGYGGTGKTWSALTFPHSIVANLDRGLGAHADRSDVVEIPFYNEAFCNTIYPNYKPENLKDLLLIWLDKYGRKLSPEQNLVWDGNTTMQNAYHKWYSKNKVVTKSGSVDDFAEWRLKTNFYSEVMEILKTLPCHVMFLAHEADKKEKDGTYRGKIKPLLTGQFGDELLTHFTDWFRMHSCAKPDANKMDATKLAQWGMTAKEFQDMLSTFPRNTMYFWQTSSDDICDTKCSSLVNYPEYIPASYEYFKKYMRHGK